MKNLFPAALAMILFVGLLLSLNLTAADNKPGGLPSPAVTASFPEVSQLPSRPELPDPLVMMDGRRVASKEQWVNQRRPELKALFQHYMYGYFPAPPTDIKFILGPEDRQYFGGKATRKYITIAFGPPQAPKLNLLLVIPNRRDKPAPAFLGLNFNGNYTVLNDPAIPLPEGWMPGTPNNRAVESRRGSEASVWNIEQSIDRGYAVATFYNGDLDPDKPDFTDGVHPWFHATPASGAKAAGEAADAKRRGPHEWGTIAAWAWGFHRAMDYLVTDKDIDARRIAIVGHSRNGKAALLAGAFDERVALVIPLQAGCGGTSPNRGKIGESVQRINTSFPHWFDDEYKKFNEQVDRLPFDQHCLIALIAPRPILLANATEDTWANPAGQFEMLQAAEPVYRLLNAGGLDAKQMPEAGKLVDSKLGYFIRPGKHSMTKDDWKIFLDFADKHFGKP